MKLTNIFLTALASLAFVACNNDTDKIKVDQSDYVTNTKSDVFVAMGQSEYSGMENSATPFKIPVVVTGNPDGYVKVTLECVGYGSNPAVADVNYYLLNSSQSGTTVTLNINPDDKVAYVELTPVDSRKKEDAYTFQVKITKVEGATLSGLDYTTVAIEDKGSSPTYDELAGSWIMSGLELSSTGYIDAEYVQEVTLQCTDPDEKIVRVNKAVDGSMTFYLTWDYDYEDQWGTIVLENGCSAGTYAGVYDLTLETYYGNNFTGVWDSTYSTISFGTTDDYIYVYAWYNGSLAGYLDVISGFTLTRVKE